jgi:hypothetical protein
MALPLGPTSKKRCHASESWHPESAYRPMFFQTLDSGFRRNDDAIRGFFLKVVPLPSVPFLFPFYLFLSC